MKRTLIGFTCGHSSFHLNWPTARREAVQLSVSCGRLLEAALPIGFQLVEVAKLWIWANCLAVEWRLPNCNLHSLPDFVGPSQVTGFLFALSLFQASKQTLCRKWLNKLQFGSIFSNSTIDLQPIKSTRYSREQPFSVAFACLLSGLPVSASALESFPD